MQVLDFMVKKMKKYEFKKKIREKIEKGGKFLRF